MINIPYESDALKSTYIIKYLYFNLFAKERHQKKRLPVYSNLYYKVPKF